MAEIVGVGGKYRTVAMITMGWWCESYYGVRKR